MALFKILKGTEDKLPSSKNEGWAYFTTDQGNFFVDVSSTERVQLNANHSKYDLEEFSVAEANKTPIHQKYLKLAGGTMEGDLFFSAPNGVWQMQMSTTQSPFIGWLNSSLPKTYASSIGRNAGYTSNDTTGAIYILPYDTDTSPYGGEAGLFISKGLLKLDGKVVPQLSTTSTDNRIVRFDGTSGALQNSKVIINDSGHLYAATNNSATLGTSSYKWKALYTVTTYSSGGVSLYGTSSPLNDGIIESNTAANHGYATSKWKMQFGLNQTTTDIGGWTFAIAQVPVASINRDGYMQVNRLDLNRATSFANGRISWMSPTCNVWNTYLSDVGNGSAPNQGAPSTLGRVNGYAFRSLAENGDGNGWIWEAAADAVSSSLSASVDPIMALSAKTKNLYLTNDLKIIMKDQDRFVHYLYDADDVNSIHASWRAGVLGTGTANENYYVIQSGCTNTSPTTDATWHNTVRIGQNDFDVTFGTTNKGGIGLANTDITTGIGISLYGGASKNKPTYGMFFGGTTPFGSYGAVTTGNRATYFTMDSTAGRGWVFLKANTPIASLSNAGILSLGGNEAATNIDQGTLRISGGLSTTADSYFGDDIVVKNKVTANTVKVTSTGSTGSSTLQYGSSAANVTATLPAYSGNVTISMTSAQNPTSSTSYNIPFYVNNSNRISYNDGFRYNTLEGTASAVGYSSLYLGNSTASGTAGNKYGRILLYGQNSYYAWIQTRTSPAYNKSIFYLPAGDTNEDACYAVWSPNASTAVGSAAQPVYVGANGKVLAGNIIYGPSTQGAKGQLLVSTGSTPQWSSNLYYTTTTSSGQTTPGTINALSIYGATYGNTTANIKTAGKLSYGDPGPQLRFNTSASGSQGISLIYTDNDSIYAGNSLTLTSTETDAAFIAPTLVGTNIKQGQYNINRLYSSLVPAGTSITANADLKTTTYLKVGNYTCSSNGTTATLKNCPVSKAFLMQVYSPLSATIDNETTAKYVYRIRKIIEYSSGIEYVQSVYSGATAGTFTYGSWKIVPHSTITLDTTDTNGATLTKGSTTQPVYINSDGLLSTCTAYSGLLTALSWSNRTLSITVGGTTKTAAIPTTLTGFTSITSTTFVGALNGNATTASALTNIASGDLASSTSTKRYVWFSYDNNTTGRPAYSPNFTYQTQEGLLRVEKAISLSDKVKLEYVTSTESLDFVFI